MTLGGLQVELESIALNVGVVDAKSSAATPSSSSSKKCKFMAFVPKEGDHAATHPETGRAEQVASSSSNVSATNDHCELASSTTATHHSPRSVSRSMTPTDDSIVKGVVAVPAGRARGKVMSCLPSWLVVVGL